MDANSIMEKHAERGHWTEAEALDAVLTYIDNQRSPMTFDCFLAQRVIDEELADAEGEERTFEVEVSRIGYGNRIITVRATSARAARRAAEDEAGNHTFDEHTSEYEAFAVAEVKDENS